MDQLMDTYNNIIETGHFLQSWIQEIITVLSKDNGDLTLPASYQPIYLLNIDYSVKATKILQLHWPPGSTLLLINMSIHTRWDLSLAGIL